MIGEEALQIDAPHALLILLEADRLEKRLIVGLSQEAGIMNTAQIDEIECSSTQHEHGLKILHADDGGKIVKLAALRGKLELANAAKLAVHGGGVCQKIGIIRNAATEADFLLLGLGLNG